MTPEKKKNWFKSPKTPLIAALMLLATAVGVAIAEKPRENALSHIKFDALAGKTEVTIAAAYTPTYTVFKMKSPDRLIVDVTDGDVNRLGVLREFDKGHVTNFTTASFDAEGRKIGRLIFGVTEDVEYVLNAEEDKLTIKFTGTLTAERTPETTVRKAEAPANRKPQAAAENSNAEPATVIRVIENDRVVVKGIKVKGQNEAARIIIETEPPAETFEALELDNPPRFVVDIPNAVKDKNLKDFSVKHPAISKVRFGQDKSRLRVVFDVAPKTQLSARVEPWNKNLAVSFVAEERAPTELVAAVEKQVKKSEEAPAKSLAKEETKQSEKAASKAVAAAKVEKPKKPAVKDITFDAQENVSVVTAEFEKMPQYRILKRGENVKILELQGVEIPEKLRRSLDASSLGGPVTMVSSFEHNKEKAVTRIVVNLKNDVKQTLTPVGNKLVWKLYGQSEAQQEQEFYTDKSLAKFAARTAQESAGDEEMGEGGTAGRPYRGKRISLDFKNADIGNILRLIADVSKLNIVASDEVKGTVTVTLRNVPWDEALDIILKSKGLGKERKGNIMRVAPLEVFQKEAEMREAEQRSKMKAAPLKVRLIPVNYAVASEISKQISDVLSDRGTISVDERTNVLIVKDIHENLVKAEHLVRNLDTQTPQVLIEARIVEANSNSTMAFGIQWGGKLSMAPGTNNETGLIFPNTIGLMGGADDSTTNTDLTGTSNPGNFAVNLPAPVGAGSGGALGFIFGSAGGAAMLNLRISAMEQEGSIKIVSSPRITTLDNKTASIEQGISIPISQVSAAGVQTVFVNATLKLEVTPHVTADGSVLMLLNISNNQPDFGRTGAQGDPTILKQQAETEMLVRDGDTAVIGGIFVRRTGQETAGVPLLSRIPVLGWLFKRKTDRDERGELLIFITPRIVNRSQSFISST